MESWKIAWLFGTSKLENPLQNWGLSKTDPQIIVLWVKEVEIAKSFDKLVILRSITGQPNFPDFDLLHVMIASALKKHVGTQSNFRIRESVEEQQLRIPTNSCEEDSLRTWFLSFSVQREPLKQYKDSQNCSLQVCRMMMSKISMYYGIMHFLTVGEMSSPSILEGLYKSKSQNSVQLQFVMALFDQDVARNNGPLNHHQLNTAAKLHNDQMMRNWNFRIRNEVVERGSVTESQKKTKPAVRWKWECF